MPLLFKKSGKLGYYAVIIHSESDSISRGTEEGHPFGDTQSDVHTHQDAAAGWLSTFGQGAVYYLSRHSIAGPH